MIKLMTPTRHLRISSPTTSVGVMLKGKIYLVDDRPRSMSLSHEVFSPDKGIFIGSIDKPDYEKFMVEGEELQENKDEDQ